MLWLTLFIMNKISFWTMDFFRKKNRKAVLLIWIIHFNHWSSVEVMDPDLLSQPVRQKKKNRLNQWCGSGRIRMRSWIRIQRYKMKGKAELKKLLGVFVVFKSKPKSVINLLGLGSNLKIIFFLDLWFESICWFYCPGSGPDPHSSNFVDPDTINADQHHCWCNPWLSFCPLD